MTRHVDIAIIGAGIAGASLAWRLRKKASVVLIERENIPGYHATGRSTFTFVETYGNPLVRRLTSASRSFYKNPPAGFSDSQLLMPRGNLSLSLEGNEAELLSLYSDAKTHTEDLHLMSPQEIHDLCPLIRNGRFTKGLYEPGAMDMDVHAIHRAFLKGTEIIVNAAVTDLHHRPGRWTVNFQSGEAIAASVLVNAAGAWATEIGGLANASSVELEPRRRSVFMFEPTSEMRSKGGFESWPLVRDWPETFYFKPSAGAVLATPANRTLSEPCDAQAEELDIAIGIDRLEKATLLKPQHLTSKWAGLRTFTADESPVVGFDQGAPDFFWLAGQGGYGIQTAPALSEIAAGLILQDGVKSLDSRWIDALDPDRLT